MPVDLSLKITKIKEIFPLIGDVALHGLYQLFMSIPLKYRERIFLKETNYILELYEDGFSISRKFDDRSPTIECVPNTKLETKSIESIKHPANAIIYLKNNKVISDSFVLPAHAGKRLISAIHFEMQQRTPSNWQDYHFAYNIAAKTDSDNFYIDAAYVLKQHLEELCSDIESFHFAKHTIFYKSSVEENKAICLHERLNSLPSPSKTGRRILLLLSIFLLIFTYIPIQLHSNINDAKALQQSLEAEVNTVMLLQQKIEKKLKAAASARAQYDHTTVLNTLTDLTNILEAKTWVQRFELHGNTVRISGYSSAASDLLDRFSASRFLSSPKFDGPITPYVSDAEKRLDRFELSAVIIDKAK